jgi:hypothetical protein
MFTIVLCQNPVALPFETCLQAVPRTPTAAQKQKESHSMMHRSAKWQHGQLPLLLHCLSWTQKRGWHWQDMVWAAMCGYG